jgi:hypothetical protein
MPRIHNDIDASDKLCAIQPEYFAHDTLDSVSTHGTT